MYGKLLQFLKPRKRDGKAREDQQGWALLGLILALAVLAIFLSASVTPSVRMAVQRDKEAELIYRGQQMAEAIARYYNYGRIGPIDVRRPPRHGYLLELKKLGEGITVGVNQRKLVRISAMTEPMANDEWEPVRVRDPRILDALNAYAAEHNVPIPEAYMLLAGPPAPINKVTPTTPEQPGAPTGQPGAPAPQPGANPPTRPTPPTGTAGDEDDEDFEEDDDDDDDDDDEGAVEEDDDDDGERPDPLAHLFRDNDSGPGKSNIPIVAVAPKVKGRSVRAYGGKTSYEEWVFIYIPPPWLFQQPQGRPALPRNPGAAPNNPGGQPRTSP